MQPRGGRRCGADSPHSRGNPDLGEKDALLASDERAYLTIPHYDGYPAVLVRLALADETELRELLVEAWTYPISVWRRT